MCRNSFYSKKLSLLNSVNVVRTVSVRNFDYELTPSSIGKVTKVVFNHQITEKGYFRSESPQLLRCQMASKDSPPAPSISLSPENVNSMVFVNCLSASWNERPEDAVLRNVSLRVDKVC